MTNEYRYFPESNFPGVNTWLIYSNEVANSKKLNTQIYIPC